MRVVLQRVSRASVQIADGDTRSIGPGLVCLLGIESVDDKEDLEWLVRKISALRIFEDTDGRMNLSVQEVEGEILVVSQFTLHAAVKKGTRPSFVKAARPEHARPLYEAFAKRLAQLMPNRIKTGEFGAMMQVELVNDGPVTIVMDTKNKE